jgi:aminoglycoside phosphotransferase (APT) family kinase protein
VRARESGLDADPAWVIFDALPRVPHLRSTLASLVDRVPDLFAERPVVRAHGDFAPVNVLTDGRSLTGLVDFESVRVTDPVFDAAWWA